MSKIKDNDIEKLSSDIINCDLLRNPPTELNDLVECYDSTISDIFEQHAPVQEKEIVLRPHAPWYTDSIRQAKQARRRAERKRMKTQLTVDREILKEKQTEMNRLCETAKAEFYSKKISEIENDSKALFCLSNKLLHKTKDESLPSHSSEKDLANLFGDYFSAKIAKIRDTFPVVERSETSMDATTYRYAYQPLDHFAEISESDLSKLILKGNSKSCSLDPMPTSLLKQVPALMPVIHTIVNRSLQETTMPDPLKQAIVKPLIKKSTLDKENLKNYRPVSNLPYIGKIIEKVAVNQIEQHLSSNNLHEPLQSAYQANHSTETALLKVTDDIL